MEIGAAVVEVALGLVRDGRLALRSLQGNVTGLVPRGDE
jgi:hypothetical protein